MTNEKPYHMLANNNHHTLVIRYDGEINSELCRGLTLAVHNQLNTLEPDLLTRKRITHIITECLLNLTHHAESTDGALHHGKYVHLLVECNDTQYFINTRNLVSGKKMNFLTNRLQTINDMNTSELYEHYMQQLQTGQYTNKGTAGLGFIDMARKSGHKLGFEFTHMNGTHMQFHFSITIDKPKRK